MPNTIYGPNGMVLGTWDDFWSRYQRPEGIWADESATAVAGGDSLTGIGTASFALGVASGAADIINSWNKAKTQKALYSMQAEINDINVRIAERQAQSELRQSEYRIAALTLKAGQIRSTQRASLAANGIQLGRGTAAELTAGTQLMKEIDTNTEKLNGLMSAWGYRFKAINAGAQATESRLRAGQSDGLSATLGAVGRNVAELSKDYYNFRKTGLLGS